jgi:hypothetical protein
MTLRLNGSTSGYTEIDAPAVAGNNNIKFPTGNGNAYQILRNGATAGGLEYTDKIVSGTVNAGGTTPFPATGGPTAVDFTGIPSWVKRVTVMLNGVSLSGTATLQMQIGSGSVATSGYLSFATLSVPPNSVTGYSSATGFITGGANAANFLYGTITVFVATGSTYVANVALGLTNSGVQYSIVGGGNVTLSGALDRVRITTNGTDTFDAGSINIMYE